MASDELPELEQKDVDDALLKEATKEDGSRLYTDLDISKFSLAVREINIDIAKKQVYRQGFEKQNQTTQDRLDGVLPFDNQPELTGEEREELEEQFQTDEDIETNVTGIIENELPGLPAPDTTIEDSEIPGAGKNLTVDIQITQRVPPEIPEAILELILPQITPVDGKLDKFRPPPLLPISTQGIMSLVMEPISRKVFVVLYFNVTGFFYILANIPCGFPLILPMPYPISPIGPAPAGVFALPFIDPTIPDCGGSQPFDVSVYIDGPPLDVAAMGLGQPCDPTLSPEAFRACQDALKQQGQEILGNLPITPQLAQLLAVIAKQSEVPVPPPRVTGPVPENEFRIFVEDDLEDFDFELEIIT